MKLILHEYDLKLKHRFSIAHDSRDIQKSLILELRDGQFSGFGEATASKYYGYSIEEMRAILEVNREQIESYQYQSPEEFWVDMSTEMSVNSFAQSALDVAVNDLYAKSKGVSLSKLWGEENSHNLVSNYTIGIDTIEKMAQKLEEFPWPSYKIKLGTKEDIAIIKELRKLTDAKFRVDANCGWGVEETLINAREMIGLGVEFIEQPLVADDWLGMKTLYEKSPLPIIADESIVGEGDIERCYGFFHGVNIKLMKCGGLTPARRMISKAKSYGMKVMVGCMTESSVGISAIAQLLPLLDYVDMDGFLLLESEIADGVRLANNTIVVPDSAGIGVSSLIS